jgi:tape measure domain-containing protein
MSSTYELEISVVGKDRASNVFKGLAGAFQSMLNIAGGVLLAGVIRDMAGQIAQLGTAALNAAGEFQLLQVGFEGLLARELYQMNEGFENIADAMPRAQVGARELMDELAKIAVYSPYTLEAVASTFRLQMAFGATSSEARNLTDGLLAMAAGIGASQSMLERMAYNLAQIKLEGKVTALDVRQLAQAGLDLRDVLQYVAQQLGYNITDLKDFNELLSSGKISWAQFAELFKKYADENFAGSAERMSKTLLGLKSTFHDLFILTIPQILLESVTLITDPMGKLVDSLMAFRELDILSGWGDSLADSVRQWIAPFSRAVDWLSQYLSLLSDLKNARDLGLDAADQSALSSQLYNMLPSGNMLEGFVEAAFGQRGVDTLNIFKAALGAIGTVANTLSPIFSAVAQGVVILINSFSTFWNENGPAIIETFDGIATSLLEFFGLVAGDTGSTIQDFFGSMGKWLIDNGPAIQEFFKNIGTWVSENLIPKLSEMVQWFEVNIPKAWEWLKARWEDTLKPAWEEIQGVIDNNILPALGRFGAFWDEHGESIATSMAKIVSDAVTNGFKILGTAIEIGLTWIADNGPAISRTLKDLATSLDTLGQWASSESGVKIIGALVGIKLAVDMLAPVLAPLKTAFYGLVGVLGTIGAVLVVLDPAILAAAIGFMVLASSIALIVGNKDKILNFFQDLWVKAEDTFTKMKDWWKGVGEDIMLGWQEGIEGNWGNLQASLLYYSALLIQTVQQVFGIASPSTVFWSIGSNLILGLIEGIVQTWGTASSTIGDLARRLPEDFRSFLGLGTGEGSSGDAGAGGREASASGPLYLIGTQLVDGFKTGFEKAWGNMMETIDKRIEDFIEMFQSKFQIHSPSKLFTKMGEDIIVGLTQGMQSEWSNLRSWFNAQVEEMSSTMQSLAEVLSSIMTGIADAHAAIENLATDFQNAMNDINSGSNSEGGNGGSGDGGGRDFSDGFHDFALRTSAKAASKTLFNEVDSLMQQAFSPIAASMRNVARGNFSTPQLVTQVTNQPINVDIRVDRMGDQMDLNEVAETVAARIKSRGR